MNTNDAVTSAGDHDRHHLGTSIRREVLGDEHVDRSTSRASEFSAPIQDWVTRACWGDVWSRDGLDRRTRSLINLVMLTALNRSHEFEVHVRGAIHNGCTIEEIRESLLHTAPYCGAPAALASFRIAERVIGELTGPILSDNNAAE